MNVATVEKQVQCWGPDDQDRLATFLAILRSRRDPAYKTELTRRLNDRDPAHWLSLEELEQRLNDK